METPILAAGLTRSFGTRQVLAGLDLEVGQGEIFGLLGPDGAGKTTTVQAALHRAGPRGGRAGRGNCSPPSASTRSRDSASAPIPVGCGGGWT